MHKPIKVKLEKSPQGEWEIPTVPPIKLQRNKIGWKIQKELDHSWSREDILQLHKTLGHIGTH